MICLWHKNSLSTVIEGRPGHQSVLRFLIECTYWIRPKKDKSKKNKELIFVNFWKVFGVKALWENDVSYRRHISISYLAISHNDKMKSWPREEMYWSRMSSWMSSWFLGFGCDKSKVCCVHVSVSLDKHTTVNTKFEAEQLCIWSSLHIRQTASVIQMSII